MAKSLLQIQVDLGLESAPVRGDPSHCTPLCLGFLICEMGILAASVTESIVGIR